MALLKQGAFEKSASRDAMRRAVHECDTVQSLRAWHENGRPFVSEADSKPLQEMCNTVIGFLEEASDQMSQLSRRQSSLQPAINALVEIFQAWDTMYDLFHEYPGLGEGTTATVAKNYVIMTLRMTLAVVSLVSPDRELWWSAWYEDLGNDLPGFTFETTFAASQSNNPTSRTFNTLPYSMIPESLVSGMGIQREEEEGELPE